MNTIKWYAAALLLGMISAVSASTILLESAPDPQANGSTKVNEQTSIITADGRFAVFCSEASNLVPGDTNGVADVFLFDRELGRVERLSVNPTTHEQGNGECRKVGITPDGRYVVFYSGAGNLVPDDNNGVADIFRLDRQTGSLEIVSLADDESPANNFSDGPSISDDGRYVAFFSYATNLVPGFTDNNGSSQSDVFVRDIVAGTTVLVSTDASDPLKGADRPAFSANISAAGGAVAFVSAAANLVVPDTNNKFDTFVRDVFPLGPIKRVSDPPGGGEGNQFSLYGTLTGDGRYVAFSTGSDLGNGGGTYLYDRNLQALQYINGGEYPRISNDGEYIVSLADGYNNVFLWNRTSNATVQVSFSEEGASANNQSTSPDISDNPADAANIGGRYVAYVSGAWNLVPEDLNGAVRDVFLQDRQIGSIQRINVATAKSPGGQPDLSVFPGSFAFSSDGRLSAYEAGGQVWVRHRESMRMEKVSINANGDDGNGACRGATLSGNGQFAAFSSAADNLVANDQNGFSDIFIRDRVRNTIERVSMGIGGAEADDESLWPVLSEDGRYLAFMSKATNLVADTLPALPVNPASAWLFLLDRATGEIRYLGISKLEGGTVSLSADGSSVAYINVETRFPNSFSGSPYPGDAVVYDRDTATHELLSVARNGDAANANTRSLRLSRDGHHACITTNATNMLPTDTPAGNTFVRDRLLQATEQASIKSDGSQGTAGSLGCDISRDGRYVAITSLADDLGATLATPHPNLYWRDRMAHTTELVSSYGANYPEISGNGRYVAFLRFYDGAGQSSDPFYVSTSSGIRMYAWDRFGDTGVDVDGDSWFSAQTDGLLIRRHMEGSYTGALRNRALGRFCIRCSETEITDYITGLGMQLDIDGNGSIEAQFDGELVNRCLLGYVGDDLISGAVGAGCTRCSASEISSYCGTLMP